MRQNCALSSRLYTWSGLGMSRTRLLASFLRSTGFTAVGEQVSLWWWQE